MELLLYAAYVIIMIITIVQLHLHVKERKRLKIKLQEQNKGLKFGTSYKTEFIPKTREEELEETHEFWDRLSDFKANRSGLSELEQRQRDYLSGKIFDDKFKAMAGASDHLLGTNRTVLPGESMVITSPDIYAAVMRLNAYKTITGFNGIDISKLESIKINQIVTLDEAKNMQNYLKPSPLKILKGMDFGNMDFSSFHDFRYETGNRNRVLRCRKKDFKYMSYDSTGDVEGVSIYTGKEVIHIPKHIVKRVQGKLLTVEQWIKLTKKNTLKKRPIRFKQLATARNILRNGRLFHGR